MKKIYKKIVEFLGGASIPVVGDLLIYFLDDDVGMKKLFWGVLPIPYLSDLVYFIDSGEENNDDNDIGMRGPDRNKTWSDIDKVDDSGGFDIDLSSFGSILKPLFIFGLIAGGLGIVGLVAGSFLGFASGPAAVAGDYLGANVDGPDFSGLSFMAGKAMKTVSCFGDAGCIREWQLNNTRRPGSEDVGETYKLNIKNFQIYGTGSGVDVSFNQPDSSIPIYFLLQNTRQGLKGIPARDVEYKVKVRDEGLGTSQNYCETEWLDLQTNYGEGEDEVLIPGAAAEPLNWQDQLTLRECGLLRPGPGNYVNFALEVRYDYSSKSTLYVDAMSQEHRRSQQIPIDFSRSETADTPVETYIETRSPILFASSGSERTAIPFTTRVGVHTDERKLGYTIDTSGFRFEDSSITTDEEGSCQGLEPVEGEENQYKISEQTRKAINTQQQDQYFNYQTQPPPASCTMRIEEEDLNSISRTGETLTMSADVNYTVKLEEKEESFKIFNGDCATANCPYLVPLSGSNITSDVINTDLNNVNPMEAGSDYWAKQYAYCKGNQDKPNGCTVVEGYNPDERVEVAGAPTIEEGDIAVDLSTAPESPLSLIKRCDSPDPTGVASVKMEELEKAVNPNFALSLNNGDWEAERRCGSSSQKSSSNDGDSGDSGSEKLTCQYNGNTFSSGEGICSSYNPQGSWTQDKDVGEELGCGSRSSGYRCKGTQESTCQENGNTFNEGETTCSSSNPGENWNRDQTVDCDTRIYGYRCSP